jgi:hypothetical protein
MKNGYGIKRDHYYPIKIHQRAIPQANPTFDPLFSLPPTEPRKQYYCFEVVRKKNASLGCCLPIAANAEDDPLPSLDVHHISPISNPKPAHATCR